MLSEKFIKELFRKGREREVLFFTFLYANLCDGYSISVYEIQSRFGIPKTTIHRLMEQKWNESGMEMEWKWNKNSLIFSKIGGQGGMEMEQKWNRNGMELKDKPSINEAVKVEVERPKKRKENTPQKKEESNESETIVAYLNQVTGKTFSPNISATKALISKRFSEGFCREDFFKVIELKANEWLNTDFDKYLRPQTLFGSKFESYLNSRAIEEKQTELDFHIKISRNEQYEAAADRAREIDYGTLADQ